MLLEVLPLENINGSAFNSKLFSSECHAVSSTPESERPTSKVLFLPPIIPSSKKIFNLTFSRASALIEQIFNIVESG